MSQASSLPTCVGPYRIVRQLGAGGMGAVFEGLHEAIARRVAIKVLHADYNTDKEIVQRLFTEARATNLIEHPSLVQVSDFGQLADGRPYLVMELLKGESLGERLRRLPRPPLAWVLAVAWQIADALTAAHERGIIHRDLKPDNIMLVPDSVAQGGERIKVLDFGLAKEAYAGGALTSKSAVMGTPLYMSPEQCRGAGGVDERTDVYALGVILYEMVAGQPPFQGPSGELISFHLFKEPSLLSSYASGISTEFEALVHRLLEKDREHRLPMAQVRAELWRHLLAEKERPDTDAAAAPPDLVLASASGTQLPARRTAPWIAGGLLVVGMAALLWQSQRSTSRSKLPVAQSPPPTASSAPLKVAPPPVASAPSPPAVPPLRPAAAAPEPGPRQPLVGSGPQTPDETGGRPLRRRPAKTARPVARSTKGVAPASSRASSFDDVD